MKLELEETTLFKLKARDFMKAGFYSSPPLIHKQGSANQTGGLKYK